MLDNILSGTERRLFDEVRGALRDAATELEAATAPAASRDALTEAIRRLDLPFLLVVVGEFNSGKSSLLNALLGLDLLEQGVTPTTSRIHVLRYGDAVGESMTADGTFVVEAPAELLRDVELVDTPGTNAIDQAHEALTRDFLPRSDLVLFVTSADRPFTESERAFLAAIREWGKKVVVVVNKIDILQEETEVAEVTGYVGSSCEKLLGFLATRLSGECAACSRRRHGGAL